MPQTGKSFRDEDRNLTPSLIVGIEWNQSLAVAEGKFFTRAF